MNVFAILVLAAFFANPRVFILPCVLIAEWIVEKLEAPQPRIRERRPRELRTYRQ